MVKKSKDVVNEHVREMMDDVHGWIRKNPAAAAGIAFGIGAVIGSALLMRRR